MVWSGALIPHNSLLTLHFALVVATPTKFSVTAASCQNIFCAGLKAARSAQCFLVLVPPPAVVLFLGTS